jgi:hypothetical protein
MGAFRPCTFEAEAIGCGEKNNARAAGKEWAPCAARIGKPDCCFSFAVQFVMACIEPTTLRHRRVSEATAQSSREDEFGGIAQTTTRDVEEYPTHWELSRMRKCGAISDDDFRELKYDLYTCEWEAMLKKGCISKEDFESLRRYFRKCKSAEGLRAMRDRGTISDDEFKKLMYDLDWFELEGLLKRGIISENDFQIRQEDLKQRRHTGELKAMRNRGAISVEDYKRFLEGYGLIKFQLEGMLIKGSISEGDIETLSADLRRLECAGEFAPLPRCGATLAEDFSPRARHFRSAPDVRGAFR